MIDKRIDFDVQIKNRNLIPIQIDRGDLPETQAPCDVFTVDSEDISELESFSRKVEVLEWNYLTDRD